MTQVKSLLALSVLFVSFCNIAHAEDSAPALTKCQEESLLPLCSAGLHIHCCPADEDTLSCGQFHIPVRDANGRIFCIIRPPNGH